MRKHREAKKERISFAAEGLCNWLNSYFPHGPDHPVLQVMRLVRETIDFMAAVRSDHGKPNESDLLRWSDYFDRIRVYTRQFPFFLTPDGGNWASPQNVSFGYEMLADIKEARHDWGALLNFATISSAGQLDRIRRCPRKNSGTYFYAARTDKFACKNSCAVAIRNSTPQRKELRAQAAYDDYHEDDKYRKARTLWEERNPGRLHVIRKGREHHESLQERESLVVPLRF